VKIVGCIRKGCFCERCVQRIHYQGSSRGVGDFKRGEKIISTVKYTLYLVLLAREQTVLQSVIDRLIETGRWYGNKMNVDEAQVCKNANEAIASTDYDSSKRNGECAIFQLFWEA
jgi:hypothetical protein